MELEFRTLGIPGPEYLSPLPPGSRYNLPKYILCFYRVIKHFEWEFSRVRKNRALKIAYEILYLQLFF